MKKLFTSLLFLTVSISFLGQTCERNLEKYWNYRNRLRKKFIIVTDKVMDYGVSIPASDIFYNSTTDATQNKISWGDANNNMSHYLTVLATELWLLKNNGQDYSTTLKELYYAMLALERLDAYSESNLRWKKILGPGKKGTLWVDDCQAKSFIQPGDINGFFLRNDVTPGFWEKYGSHFDVGGYGSVFDPDNEEFFMEENSQDVIEHTMEGLGLVSKLVGLENITNIPCNFQDASVKPYLRQKGILVCDADSIQTPQKVDFSLWAKDVVKRFISYMQSDETFHGTIGGILPFSTHWILKNPVTKTWVKEGNGRDGGVAMIAGGILKAGKEITGEDLRKYPPFFSYKKFSFGFKRPHFLALFKKHFDDNLSRSVACSGNVSGIKTFTVLRHLRDRYNPDNAASKIIYEHFPLLYLALNHLNYHTVKLPVSEINADRILYETLLNSAPETGPATNCGVHEWTSTSRCLWPRNLGHPTEGQKKTVGTYTEFNGLDYMMLHNLYYIAFQQKNYRELQLQEKSR